MFSCLAADDNVIVFNDTIEMAVVVSANILLLVLASRKGIENVGL